MLIHILCILERTGWLLIPPNQRLFPQAGVRYAARAPHAYVDSNIRGSVTLLEAIRRAPQHRGRPPAFIYASSSSVYGLSESVPFSETDVVNRPASLYAATKAALELTSHVYHHIYGVTAIGLRLFTVYGPWVRAAASATLVPVRHSTDTFPLRRNPVPCSALQQINKSQQWLPAAPWPCCNCRTPRANALPRTI